MSGSPRAAPLEGGGAVVMRHNPTFPPSLNSIPAAAGASAAKRRSKAGLRRASAKPPKAEASQADVETAIAETASKAEWLLFDQSGKRKPYQDFLVLLACRTILRPVPHEPQDDPEALIVRWQEYLFVCDQELVQIFIQAAHGGDEICDRCLCIAASIELQTAKTISDNHLRKYVINKLFGGVVAPTMKKRRGRKSSDNALRNTCIVALLIPPLMPRFSA